MSLLGLLISLLLFLTAFLIVARPLWTFSQRNSSPSPNPYRQREQLQNYYQRVLTNIRDLDEDFATHKINPADYHQEREVWLERGIRLLRAQDSLTLDSDPHAIDQAIEEAILSHRQRQHSEPHP